MVHHFEWFLKVHKKLLKYSHSLSCNIPTAIQFNRRLEFIQTRVWFCMLKTGFWKDQKYQRPWVCDKLNYPGRMVSSFCPQIIEFKEVFNDLSERLWTRKWSGWLYGWKIAYTCTAVPSLIELHLGFFLGNILHIHYWCDKHLL